jgi:SAM-dependent methyltransferase
MLLLAQAILESNQVKGNNFMTLPTLRKIFDEHQRLGSDKWTSYFETYDRHFTRYRNDAITLLEIGVQNGGSLEIWSKYFPKAARILGCDIEEKCRALTFEDPRIEAFIGDANSPPIYERLTKDTPNFDIIIDDGSHHVDDVVRSFALYFPTLKPGGVYVIEDLHTSYWPQYGGGTDLTLSSMGFLKLLADLTNKEFWREDKDFNFLEAYAERYSASLHDHDINIDEISFRNSICVIRKGDGTFKNRRHISGSIFQVADHSEIKKLSGTQDLVDLLDVAARLAQSTELQKEFVTTIPLALANKAEIDELKREVIRVRELALEHAQQIALAHRSTINELRERLATAEIEAQRGLSDAHQRLADAQSDIAALRASTSWRFTSPLRAVSGLWRR